MCNLQRSVTLMHFHLCVVLIPSTRTSEHTIVYSPTNLSSWSNISCPSYIAMPNLCIVARVVKHIDIFYMLSICNGDTHETSSLKFCLQSGPEILKFRSEFSFLVMQTRWMGQTLIFSLTPSHRLVTYRCNFAS